MQPWIYVRLYSGSRHELLLSNTGVTPSPLHRVKTNTLVTVNTEEKITRAHIARKLVAIWNISCTLFANGISIFLFIDIYFTVALTRSKCPSIKIFGYYFSLQIFHFRSFRAGIYFTVLCTYRCTHLYFYSTNCTKIQLTMKSSTVVSF